MCVFVDDLYLLLDIVHTHGGAVDRRGQQNTVFAMLVDLTILFETQ